MAALSKSRFDQSLTEGPILGAVWKLAWPTMLQNIIAGMQGLIDHAMVGHYVGHTGNAAIGVSWQIFLVVIVFISSLFTGMGVLVARFVGANDEDKVNRVVYQAFLTAIGLSVGLFAPVGYFLAPRLLVLVNAAPQVQAEALPYLRILFVFSLGSLLFFMTGGALRSAGDARTPLRLGLLLTVLNLTFNVILIRGLGPIPALGTRGAAIGTVLAGGIVAALAISWLFSGKLVVRLSGTMRRWPDLAIIRSLFRFGLPTGIQGVAMNIGGVLLLRYVGSLAHSAEAQAAYVVAYTQLFSLVTWTSIGLMAAASSLAGQNLGAGKPERTRRTVATAARMGMALAAFFGLFFWIIPGRLLGIFGMEDPTVLALGGQLLRYLAVSGLFLTAALAYNGGLQGAGDTKSPMYISLISQLLLPLGICAFFQATRGLHPTDIWLAIVAGHATRCLLSYARFRQGHWQRIEVKLAEEGA